MPSTESVSGHNGAPPIDVQAYAISNPHALYPRVISTWSPTHPSYPYSDRNSDPLFRPPHPPGSHPYYILPMSVQSTHSRHRRGTEKQAFHKTHTGFAKHPAGATQRSKSSKDIKGYVPEFSRERSGSLFIQKALSAQADLDGIRMVINELVEDGLLEISMDAAGNYFMNMDAGSYKE
ncbi:hypothetical protein D9611_005209 [Ephemerocybe angulata]|uniref:Uncharacterized protein n=1 Tax=Ephemerocybe angulata TaxID=980116 RepID=A0A8H5C1T2_9AGAR|nr:hypothetical protein D9611_005209 [Tulosesus angulatus]